MTRNDRDGLLERRLLEAAAAREGEVPGPSHFLEARLRARIEAARAARPESRLALSMGALAWRAMPALVLALALLGVWTGVETVRAARAQDDAVTALVEAPEPFGEAPLGDELQATPGVRP